MLLSALIVTAPLALQATRHVPVEDPVMPVIEHLIRARVLADPAPLTRPFPRDALRRALAAVDTLALDPVVRRALAQAREALDPVAAEPRYGLDLALAAGAGTHATRDPLRPRGPDWIGVRGTMAMHATMGPLVLAAEPYFDTHLEDDPDWPGDRDNVDIPGRFTNAYVGIRTRYADVTFGAYDRNWGAPGLDGLLVSSFPYSYDALTLRLGTDQLRVETLLTELDGLPSPGGEVINRFFIAHRVTFRPIRPVLFAIGTGTIYRGVGATWDTRFLNPFKLPRVTAVDEGLADSANSAYTGDLRFELPRGLVLSAQLLLDDWDVSPSVRALPDRIGGTVVADVPLSPRVALRALYTGVSSLAYRTQQGPDFAFLRNGIGLGRNHSDYTQATLAASLLAPGGLVIAPEVTWLRQGESDLGAPFPATPAPDYPFVLVGVVETTWRFATRVDATLPGGLSLRAHAGLHATRNAGNVAGARRTAFVGGIVGRWRFLRGRWR